VSDVRALLGDLVVASVELAEANADPQRWLALASATAAAMRASPGEEPGPLLAELLATLDEHELLARVRQAFEDSWPRIGWEKACVMRSGFEALRDIFEVHAASYVERVDTSRLEQRMIQHGEALFVPLPVPDGTPAHHWWWHAGAPPAEQAIQMNERMRDLLPPRGYYTDNAPAKFRRLVAAGFAFDDDLLFFRARRPLHVPMPKGRAHETYIEADTNVVRFSEVLEVDPSRRPVDLAAAALACARHVAYELRRGFPPCRIVVNVHPSLNTIRFHQIRAGQDWATKDGTETSLDHYTSAMLVLDTRA